MYSPSLPGVCNTASLQKRPRTLHRRARASPPSRFQRRNRPATTRCRTRPLTSPRQAGSRARSSSPACAPPPPKISPPARAYSFRSPQIEPVDALAKTNLRRHKATAPSFEAETPRMPSLVARLMGIDGLHDQTSPSPASNKKPAARHSFKENCYSAPACNSSSSKEKKKHVIPESMNRREPLGPVPSTGAGAPPLLSPGASSKKEEAGGGHNGEGRDEVVARGGRNDAVAGAGRQPSASAAGAGAVGLVGLLQARRRERISFVSKKKRKDKL